MKLLSGLIQISFLFFVNISPVISVPTNLQRTTPIGVGEMAPDFTLEDQNRNSVTLSSGRGKHPVVLVFYRGNW